MNKRLIVATISFLILCFAIFPNHGIGIFCGNIWGLINFYAIKQLVFHSLHSDKDYLKIGLFFFLKFPLIYAVGYWLLLSNLISPMDFLIGFSGSLIIFIQQLVWRFLRFAKNIPKKEM